MDPPVYELEFLDYTGCTEEDISYLKDVLRRTDSSLFGWERAVNKAHASGVTSGWSEDNAQIEEEGWGNEAQASSYYTEPDDCTQMLTQPQSSEVAYQFPPIPPGIFVNNAAPTMHGVAMPGYATHIQTPPPPPFSNSEMTAQQYSPGGHVVHVKTSEGKASDYNQSLPYDVYRAPEAFSSKSPTNRKFPAKVDAGMADPLTLPAQPGFPTAQPNLRPFHAVPISTAASMSMPLHQAAPATVVASSFYPPTPAAQHATGSPLYFHPVIYGNYMMATAAPAAPGVYSAPIATPAMLPMMDGMTPATMAAPVSMVAPVETVAAPVATVAPIMPTVVPVMSVISQPTPPIVAVSLPSVARETTMGVPEHSSDTDRVTTTIVDVYVQSEVVLQVSSSKDITNMQQGVNGTQVTQEDVEEEHGMAPAATMAALTGSVAPTMPVVVPVMSVVSQPVTNVVSFITPLAGANETAMRVPENSSLYRVSEEQLRSSSTSFSSSSKEEFPHMSTPPRTTQKSWASLFKPECTPIGSMGPIPESHYSPAGTSTTSPGETSKRPGSEDIALLSPEEGDKRRLAERLGEHLNRYELDHRTVSLQPRGLSNRGNWCYINATLQALVACPPFYNLMRSLTSLQGSKRYRSSFPVTDSVIDFLREFSPMQKAIRRDKNKRDEIQIQLGLTFEPVSIYRMLNSIKTDAFKVEGRQEDAEEFLSCLLNCVQDEMTELMKTAARKDKEEISSSRLSNGMPEAANGEVGNKVPDWILGQAEEEEWQVMGPRNRACITRKSEFYPTPISEIFGGQIRSVVHQAGAQPTANLQPFFSLQLDIQSDKVTSVRDALDGLVCREAIEGYTCAKTHQEVEASRQITLEELPRVLVLHLKRFIYDDKSGGSQKLLKQVDFQIDMELSKDLLSANAKTKFTHRQRQYKLFAVVYHDGKEASKGHYVTDLFHAGYGVWVRFDDSMVKPISEQQMLKHSPPRVPYLLYYRRGDTLSPPIPSSPYSLPSSPYTSESRR